MTLIFVGRESRDLLLVAAATEGLPQLPVIQKAVVAFRGEYDVVQEANPEQFTGFHEAAGNQAIVVAGGDVARGVVVGAEDRRGAVGDRVGKDLARMNQGSIHQPYRYDPDHFHLVGTVEGDGDEVLLPSVRVVLQQRDRVTGLSNPVVARRHDTPGELEHRGELRGFCRSHSTDPHEVLGGTGKTVPVQSLQDPPGKTEDVGFRRAASEHCSDQVLVAETCGTGSEDSLPGHLPLGRRPRPVMLSYDHTLPTGYWTATPFRRLVSSRRLGGSPVVFVFFIYKETSMKDMRLVRIDPAKTAGLVSILAIIGSVLWIPLALIWRNKMIASEAFTAMQEQFGTMPWMAEVPPVWLILISPLTNGGIVLVTTLITVAIVNALLPRIGGIPYRVEDHAE